MTKASGVPWPLRVDDDLLLTATTASDAEPLFAVVDAERDRLREWLPWLDATHDLDAEREFLRSIDAANVDGTGLHATIRLDGAVVGMVGLRVTPMHRQAEVGYWLASAATGRGAMTRSVAALVDVAFNRLDIHRVQLRAATGNQRSRAVAERLGMRHEGTLRDAEWLYDHYVDLELYAVLAPEWTSGP